MGWGGGGSVCVDSLLELGDSESEGTTIFGNVCLPVHMVQHTRMPQKPQKSQLKSSS
jgi:hypothetical protein